MYERGVAELEHQRQGGQPGSMIVVEALPRPLRGRPRPAVEPGQIQTLGHAVLVVAGHDPARSRGEQLDTRLGVRAVAHRVTETEDAVGARVGVVENGAQGFEIGVDVRQDRVLHAVRMRGVVPGGCGPGLR
jgi:hypothetical protein